MLPPSMLQVKQAPVVTGMSRNSRLSMLVHMNEAETG